MAAAAARRRRRGMCVLTRLAGLLCVLQLLLVALPTSDGTWLCGHAAALPYAVTHTAPTVHLPRDYHHLPGLDTTHVTHACDAGQTSTHAVVPDALQRRQRCADELLASRDARTQRGHGSREYTGKGVRVALLDSGLASGYGAHSSNVVECISVVPGVTCDAHGHAHGTRSASVLAGNLHVATASRTPRVTLRERVLDAAHYVGIAPHVDLLVWRVFDTHGHTSPRYVADALAMVRARNVDVLVLPYGSSSSSAAHAATTTDSVRVTTQLQALAAARVVIVAAAGNDGPASAVSTLAATLDALAVGALRAHAAAAATRRTRAQQQRVTQPGGNGRHPVHDGCTTHAAAYTRVVADFSSRGPVTLSGLQATMPRRRANDAATDACDDERHTCLVKPDVVTLGEEVVAVNGLVYDKAATTARQTVRLSLATAHGTSIAAAALGGIVALCIEAMRAVGVTSDKVHIGSVASVLLQSAVPLQPPPPRAASLARTSATAQRGMCAAEASAQNTATQRAQGSAYDMTSQGAGEVLACRALAFARTLDATLMALRRATTLPAGLCIARAKWPTCAGIEHWHRHDELVCGAAARTYSFTVYFAQPMHTAVYACTQAHGATHVPVQVILHVTNVCEQACDAQPRRQNGSEQCDTHHMATHRTTARQAATPQPQRRDARAKVKVQYATLTLGALHAYTGVLRVRLQAPQLCSTTKYNTTDMSARQHITNTTRHARNGSHITHSFGRRHNDNLAKRCYITTIQGNMTVRLMQPPTNERGCCTSRPKHTQKSPFAQMAQRHNEQTCLAHNYSDSNTNKGTHTPSPTTRDEHSDDAHIHSKPYTEQAPANRQQVKINTTEKQDNDTTTEQIIVVPFHVNVRCHTP